MKIWANTLVKNEERYIWYSVASVIEHVEKMLIWDTGSSDETVEIVKEIKKWWPDKIEFKEIGEVDINQFSEVRQEMLKVTKSDWVMIHDGDEVWWDKSIKETVSFIRENNTRYETVVTQYKNLVGDIYHYQEDSAGKYKIDGKSGFLTIRFMNMNIPGLNVYKPHGQQGFFDKDGLLIQDRDRSKRKHIPGYSYLHFTNLVRSESRNLDLKVPKRKIKYKHDLGHQLPLDYYYPESFFKDHPEIIQQPWLKRSRSFYLYSFVLTPFRRAKRKFIQTKSGY